MEKQKDTRATIRGVDPKLLRRIKEKAAHDGTTIKNLVNKGMELVLRRS